jgi:hypothetical protein
MFAVPSPRGALRNVINAGRDAVDADVPTTNGTEADGEVVWFWRLDAGVKLAEVIPPMTVTKKPDHREEHEVTVKTIAQGMPAVPVNLW